MNSDHVILVAIQKDCSHADGWSLSWSSQPTRNFWADIPISNNKQKHVCILVETTFKSQSSRLWYHVVMWYDISVSEGHAASIFRAKWMALRKRAWLQVESTREGKACAGWRKAGKYSDTSSRRGMRWCTRLDCYRYKVTSEESSPCQ